MRKLAASQLTGVFRTGADCRSGTGVPPVIAQDARAIFRLSTSLILFSPFVLFLCRHAANSLESVRARLAATKLRIVFRRNPHRARTNRRSFTWLNKA